MNAFKRFLEYTGGCFLIVGGIIAVTWFCVSTVITVFSIAGPIGATIVGVGLFSMCFGLVGLIDDEERGDM